MRYQAEPLHYAHRFPPADLIDGGTGSGAEAVAAALADSGRAVLIGSRTLGDGSVRTFVSMGQDQVLALVTGRMIRPSGAPFKTNVVPHLCTNAAPDCRVDAPPPAERDVDLARAVAWLRAEMRIALRRPWSGGARYTQGTRGFSEAVDARY